MTVMPLEWVLGRDKKHAIGTWKRHKSIVKLLVSKWKNIIEKEKRFSYLSHISYHLFHFIPLAPSFLLLDGTLCIILMVF